MSTYRDQLPERTKGDPGNFPTYLFSTTLKCILHTQWAYGTPEATELSKVIHIKSIGAWEWLSITNNNLNNSYNSFYFGSLGSFINVKLFFFLNFTYLLYWVGVGFFLLHEYISVHHMHELQTVESYYVVAGNQIWAL